VRQSVFIHFFVVKETNQRKRPKYLRLSTIKHKTGRKIEQVFCVTPFLMLSVGEDITGESATSMDMRN